MIGYKVIHHVSGRIRIEIPGLKGLSMETLKQLSIISIPAGIRDVRPNPFTGSIVIQYDPKAIDIIKYIEDIASDKEIQEVIGKGGQG